MELVHTLYDVADGVATITLNRPEHLNAFTPNMRKELKALFHEADQDDAVRVVVVTGAGRAFCAGADLTVGAGKRWHAIDDDGNPTAPENHRDGGGQVVLAAHACRKPIIAAINGPAVGVGITMTLAMDIRIVAADAKVGFVFNRRGLCPEACSTWFLPRLVGAGKAAELVFTGRVFRAQDEAASGLFNYVLPAEEVVPKALALAREIAGNTSAVSTAMAKALLRKGMAAGHPREIHLADSQAFLWVASHEDAAEGVQAFLQKRPPAFPLSPTADMPDFYRTWREEDF